MVVFTNWMSDVCGIVWDLGFASSSYAVDICVARDGIFVIARNLSFM